MRGWVRDWETWSAGTVRSRGAAPRLPSLCCHLRSIMCLYPYVALGPFMSPFLPSHHIPLKSSTFPCRRCHPSSVAINPLNSLLSPLSPRCHHRSQLPLLSRHRLLMSPAPIFCCYFSVMISHNRHLTPCHLRTLPVTLSLNRFHVPLMLSSWPCHHPFHATFAPLAVTAHASCF